MFVLGVVRSMLNRLRPAGAVEPTHGHPERSWVPAADAGALGPGAAL